MEHDECTVVSTATTTHDGVLAAQSGVIAGSQQSSLKGAITGPATVTYWWKVSCDSFWVNLSLFLNDAPENAISGTVDWQQMTNYIGAGPQTLEWRLYPVYGNFAGGTGWVDQVQPYFGGTPATITSQPVNATQSAGASVTFSVTASGTPDLSYR